MITDERRIANLLPKRGFVREYVRYASECTDANIAYHVAGALSLLSQAVPLDYTVPYLGPTPVNLYCLLVGPSTMSRKTGAIKIARRVLQIALPEHVADMPGSQEGLTDMLAERAQQLIFWGEYGSLLAQAEKGYLLQLKTRLTEVYDGDPISRRRASGRGSPIVCQSPRLSIFGGVAPGYLERHTEPVDWTEGFLARHFTILAARQRHYAMPRFDETHEVKVAAHLKALADPYRRLDDDGVVVKPCDGFTAAAMARWAAWQHEVETLIKQNPHSPVAAAIARAAGMAVKIAGLLAWDFGGARSGETWRVDLEEIECAIGFTDLHIESVLEIGSTLATDRDMRDRRRMLHAINGSPTRLGMALKKAGLTKRRGREMLETLLEEHTIEAVQIEGGSEPYYRLSAAPDFEPPAVEARPLSVDSFD